MHFLQLSVVRVFGTNGGLNEERVRLICLIAFAVLVLPMSFAKPHQSWKYAVYGIMFGIFIELAQPFVNRSGEVGDVLADACGIALGCAVGVGLRTWISRFYC